MGEWTDQFVGDRMAVDQEFSERVAASEFTRQEWGTIMTAVEFEIVEAATPEQAELVAETSSVEQIMPALEQIQEGMGAMGAEPTGQRQNESGGLLGRITSKLGLSEEGDDIDERLASAEGLADEYATAFQNHLEREGKWEQACSLAAKE